MRKNAQSGFTLVEIAIVLVIIGLLLGGILKGQELVNNAKVRNVADMESNVRAAYFAFQDRYKGLPGDFVTASTSIPNVARNGDGDGVIDAGAEQVFAWYHLTNAGFLACQQCSGDPGATPAGPTGANSPNNVYGGVMTVVTDGVYGATGTGSAARPNIKTGSGIPSNVLAEVDRKLDDGNPSSGTVQFSVYTGGGTAPTAANCVDAAVTPNIWKGNAPGANCGAADLLQ